MKTQVVRQTVELSSFPNLVVIYLGMCVRSLRGVKTIFRLARQIDKAGASHPKGLLHFENYIIYRLFPLNVGMRWYWKDFESMERWTRSEPHRIWWQKFLRDSGGTGFWHETYFMCGGMEAIYDDIKKPIGIEAFAPAVPARGSVFSSRRRLGINGDVLAQPEGTQEQDIY